MSTLETGDKNSLRLIEISKSFGGVVAANKISLTVQPGEVVGLIGPNGSGKTTLLNIISGIYSADSGEIVFNGQKITGKPSHYRAKLGIARTFQHPRLLSRCEVLTNLLLGSDLAQRKKQGNTGQIDTNLEGLLEAAGLNKGMLTQTIEKLSYGQQKMLEVVRSMLSLPKILLLDEPVAGLNEKEMERVKDLIHIGVRNNMGVLIIEHSMDLIMTICDRITVLNFGQQIATGTPEYIQTNPEVIKAYLGEEQYA